MSAARNVEIKARLADLAGVTPRVVELADTGPQTFVQEDVFFVTPRGRLKLRFLSPREGQLIFYERNDEAGPSVSHYELLPTSEPQRLKSVLGAAYGIRNVVRKKRSVYLTGRTRIHLDEVESLGDFLELEVVLADGESPDQGLTEANALLEKLGVHCADLVAEAYVDLLDALGPAHTS